MHDFPYAQFYTSTTCTPNIAIIIWSIQISGLLEKLVAILRQIYS